MSGYSGGPWFIGDYNGDGLDDIMCKINQDGGCIVAVSNGSSFVVGPLSKQTQSDEKTNILIDNFNLYQNYPNPFNPTTIIKYDLPNTSDVSLIIYDILGRKVKELVNTKQQTGRYEIQFNASSLASGVYIYRLNVNDYVATKKMILLK
jgi:hypothetical protein